MSAQTLLDSVGQYLQAAADADAVADQRSEHDQPPETHETHISWVVIAGQTALKIKKPLQNPFLNYSTLEKRLEACWAEVTLNQRYARDLYTGVVAIVPAKQGLELVRLRPDQQRASQLPPGTQEVAVRMQRFPSDALLATQLDDGKVEASCIDQLAQHIAAFHQGAEQAPQSSAWGEAARVQQDQLDNLQFLADAGTVKGQASVWLETVSRWCEGIVNSTHFQPLLEQRRRLGMVRACHGDLHLQNIVRWQGNLIPFDGIEFSESLRWIDVQSDAAFVAMDLVSHGHKNLAHRFANAYWEATGDYQGLAVWQWYLVYRASVRAKVAALRLEQSDGEQAAESRQEVAHFLELAAELTRATAPQLVITFGVSGSGKTHGSQAWIDQQGFVRIRSDVEQKRLFARGHGDLLTPPLAAHQYPAGDLYGEEATRATYDRLWHIAELGLQSDRPVLVDATFLRRADRQRFQSLAEHYGVPFGILAFHADVATMRERIKQRAEQGADASDATIEIMLQQLETLDPLCDEEQSYVQRLSD